MMAGPTPARLSQPPVFIDLTSDSDDDGSITRHNPRSRDNTGETTWRDDAAYMVSNDGLPDPTEFRRLETNGPNHSLQTTSNADSTRLSQIVRKQAYPPILPDSSLQSYQQGRASRNEAPLPRMGRRLLVQGSRSPTQGLAGGTLQSELRLFATQDLRTRHTSAKPGNKRLPGVPAWRGERIHRRKRAAIYHIPQSQIAHNQTAHNVEEEDKEESSATYSPLAAEPSSLKRRKLEADASQLPRYSAASSASSSTKIRDTKDPEPILPVPQTVIIGASRAASSGLSRPSSTLQKHVPKQLLISLRRHRQKTLVDQVYPHVKRALESHSGRLPKKTVTQIEVQVIEKLLNEPSFKHHMSNNGQMLSTEFKLGLTKRAHAYVNDAVKNAGAKSIYETFESSDVVMSDFQPLNLNTAATSPTDEASPGSEEVFENSHEIQKQRGNMLDSRFRDESSPATSFSNGRANSRNISEDASDANQNYVRDEAQSKARSTRGVPKPDYYPYKRTRSRRTNAPTSVSTSGKQTRQASVTQVVEAKKEVTAPAPQILLEALVHTRKPAISFDPNLIAMFRQLELDGMVPNRLRRGNTSYKTVATNTLEDSMSQQCQWASQSGDAVTITWTGPNTFISGALTHYDCHNMQYNRYGNLVVGSTVNKTVKMVDGHRTIRPIVTQKENLENSLPAMRATQDPWRYASVVSSAYCEKNGYVFTASYDKTVKIWQVDENGNAQGNATVEGKKNKGPSMTLKGAWKHDVHINFVVTSKHHEFVATACAINNDAVRVYTFDETDINRSPYDVYNANRAQNRPGDSRMAEPWAYHPATIQWGKAEKVSRLLLVGYSPRGASIDDEDIPEAKRNSGELCCWNTVRGLQVPISGGRSQNVFEVIWHPTQPVFVVATAPSGAYDTKRTKTQVRLFALHGLESETFACIKTLDCPAADINELTLRPTSALDAYVTASCTNGCTYVWDTMQEDKPIHVLTHGESIDNPDPNLPLEEADSGVKFAAWGQSTNRFYTGSSDGVVKSWDITKPVGKALVRTVVEAQGGIACGTFSEDYTQLMIGDATGHLHLIRSPDDDDEDEHQNPLALALARRKIIVPHPDPEPPVQESQERPEHPGMNTKKLYLCQESTFPLLQRAEPRPLEQQAEEVSGVERSDEEFRRDLDVSEDCSPMLNIEDEGSDEN